jgi:hypothetical protein
MKKWECAGVIVHFPVTAVRGSRDSQFINQIAHPDAKSLGDSHEGMNTGRFLASLQFANVNRMQVSFFRQSFLAHFGALSEPANGFADDFRMSQRFSHALSGKQEAGANDTVNSPLFCSCSFSTRGLETGKNLEKLVRYTGIYAGAVYGR